MSEREQEHWRCTNPDCGEPCPKGVPYLERCIRCGGHKFSKVKRSRSRLVADESAAKWPGFDTTHIAHEHGGPI